MRGCSIRQITWPPDWRGMATQRKSTSEETDTRLAIGWKGDYRIDGDAFVYIDRDSRRIVTILGYPTRRIAEWG